MPALDLATMQTGREMPARDRSGIATGGRDRWPSTLAALKQRLLAVSRQSPLAPEPIEIDHMIGA